MGWYVDLVKNNTVISEQCALELNSVCPDFDPESGLMYAFEEDGVWRLHFDTEAMEHIDGWLYDQRIEEILLRHKINGEARFAQIEGDSGPQMWEHYWINGLMDTTCINLSDIEF